MDAVTPSLDLTFQLPWDMYHDVIRTLVASLPPPPSGSAEDIVRRDNAAIATIASLHPASASEATLAADYVAMRSEAQECLRRSREPGIDLKIANRLTLLSASFMREARAMRTLLLRVQADRVKHEADRATLDRNAWVEHCAIGMMAEALGRPRIPPMAEPPRPAPPPAKAREEEQEPTPDPVSLADEYARIYPERAKLIRRNAGLPAKCTFGPPEDYVVRALVTGTTPTLLALDEIDETGSG